MSAKKPQCCERDHNHDGNCDRHQPGFAQGLEKEQNLHVRKWLEVHCPDWRMPLRVNGKFKDFSTSRISSCWGQPVGGLRIEGTNLRISVCQPSKQHREDQAVFLYDYIETK